jgi:tetratricopeptide (TPR) repeat protein
VEESVNPQQRPDVVAALLMNCAAKLARQGELQQAADLLSPLVHGPKQDLNASDLYARIEAQQGRFAAARALWHEILQRDPSNIPAKEAIQRIDNPRSRLPGIVLSFAAFVLIAVSLTGIHWISGLAFKQPPAAPSMPPAIQKPMLRAEEFQVAGTRAEMRDGMVRVAFPEGLFVRSTLFRPGARAILSELAKAISRSGNEVDLTLIGDTDGVPFVSSRRYPDNEALAMMRGVVVYTELLRHLPRHISVAIRASAASSTATSGPEPAKRTVLFLISSGTRGLSKATARNTAPVEGSIPDGESIK